jgi:hypothetical protein
VVHVSRLKKSQDQDPSKVAGRRPERKIKQSELDSQEEDGIIQSHPIPRVESPVEGRHDDTSQIEPDIPEIPRTERVPSRRFHDYKS